MEEALRDVLMSVDVSYVEEFERQKILKIRTVLLLSDDDLKSLIPEMGPRREFLSKIRSKPDAAANDVNDNIFSIPLVGEAVLESFPEDIPSVLLVDDQEAPSAAAIITDTLVTPLATPVSDVQASVAPANVNHSFTIECPSSTAYELDAVLNGSLNGKLVLSHYKTNEDFTDRMRNVLCDCMLADYLKDGTEKKFSRQVEKAMGAAIVKLFPKERESTYVSPRTTSRDTAAGRAKLVTRYYAIRRIMFKTGLLQRTASGQGDGVEENADNIPDYELELSDEQRRELNDKDLWLQNNTQPWPKVFDTWKDTSRRRIHKLSNTDVPIHLYVEMYPALKEPFGYLLLDSDFDHLYPEKGMNLYSNWPKLHDFIFKKVPKKIREEINESFTQEAKKIRTLRALPNLFPVLTVGRSGKKNNWRPSRAECADTLIMHVRTDGEVMAAIKRKRDKMKQFKLDLSPIAVIVGDDEDSIMKSYIFFNDILFSVESALKAFDITFKILHAVDAEYNKDVMREFLFLQQAVYTIPLKAGQKMDDKTCSLVIEFVGQQ